MKKIIVVTVIILLQVAWIVLNSYQREQELIHAPVIRATCAPIDPRDMFRGDYIILGFDIENVDSKLLNKNSYQKKMFLIVKEEKGLAIVVRAEDKKDTLLKEGELRLLCYPDRHSWSQKEKTTKMCFSPDRENKFFVPEKTGETLAIWCKNYPKNSFVDNVILSADLLVTPYSNVRMKELYLNDIPYNEAIRLIKSKQWELKIKPAPCVPVEK